MKLEHCDRCGCSLDIGDAAPATTAHGPRCVSCDLIVRTGADPWDAMMEARRRKILALAGADLEARPS